MVVLIEAPHVDSLAQHVLCSGTRCWGAVADVAGKGVMSITLLASCRDWFSLCHGNRRAETSFTVRGTRREGSLVLAAPPHPLHSDPSPHRSPVESPLQAQEFIHLWGLSRSQQHSG